MNAISKPPHPGREPADFYRTPPSCTEALLRAESLPAQVWEPACGDGAMARVLAASGRMVFAGDLIDRGYGKAGVDFLKTTHRAADALVTNPPFKLADQFVRHALGLGCSYVAMFNRLAWLEGRKRHAALWLPHPPARIHVFSARKTLWHGTDPHARDTGGTLAFAWFIWDASSPADAPPTLRWIA